MKLGIIIAIVAAVLLHLVFLLFGGILVPSGAPNHGTTQQVELLSEDDAAEKEEKVEPEPSEELKAETEAPPDADEIIRNLETPAMNNDAPSLDAASLSALEAALSGLGGSGGDFSMGADLVGGGVIGGRGRPGAMSDQMDDAFSMSEIDQKPRPVHQVSPMYPATLRGKKIEGVVTVIFIVDASGRVNNPKVEKSNNPAFDKPAMDAVKKWKFEPGVKGGERVACKMRAPIRFPAS